VKQTSSDTFHSSFYIQPSSHHFRFKRDYGSRQGREPETGPIELSLRSVHHDAHGVLALPSTSRTTIGELDRTTADHDESSFHVSIDSILSAISESQIRLQTKA
jgi:hypothetical protein